MAIGELTRPEPSSLVEQVARRIDEISSLPHVATRIIEIVHDPNASAADLKAVLETDASLSARVLRCVNSSAYALRNKVTNLQLAIAYLGFKEVRNLAVTASVADIFRHDDRIGCYTRRGLWKHMVAVGVCSRMIALRCRLTEFEDCFLAGLLHDIGIVLEDQHLHQSFTTMLEHLDPASTLSDNEQRVFGFDHGLLGAHVAKQWRLPVPVQDSAMYHHDTSAYRGDFIDVVRAVDVANLIATLKDVSSVGQNLLHPTRASIDGLGMSRNDLDVLMADLDEELSKYQSLLAF